MVVSTTLSLLLFACPRLSSRKPILSWLLALVLASFSRFSPRTYPLTGPFKSALCCMCSDVGRPNRLDWLFSVLSLHATASNTCTYAHICLPWILLPLSSFLLCVANLGQSCRAKPYIAPAACLSAATATASGRSSRVSASSTFASRRGLVGGLWITALEGYSSDVTEDLWYCSLFCVVTSYFSMCASMLV